jgi:hypothetical protein
MLRAARVAPRIEPGRHVVFITPPREIAGEIA